MYGVVYSVGECTLVVQTFLALFHLLPQAKSIPILESVRGKVLVFWTKLSLRKQTKKCPFKN